MYERLIQMLPMTYEKFVNLTKDEREEWEDFKECFKGHIERCLKCLEIIGILENVYRELEKGYRKSKIEIEVGKCLELFELKARGIYKKFDILRWAVKRMTIINCFDWTNYHKVMLLESKLWNI